MPKNPLRFFLVSALLVIGLCGCSSDDKDAPSGTASNSNPSPDTTQDDVNKRQYEKALATIEMLDTYKLIMHGSPAEASPQKVLQQFESVKSLLAQARVWNQRIRDRRPNEYCGRFLDVYDKTTREIEESYSGYFSTNDTNTKLDYSVRLTIFQGIIGTFTRAIVLGKEAGPTLVFATELGKACEFQYRDAWIEHSVKVQQGVDLMQSMTFGRKGIEDSKADLATMQANKNFRDQMDTLKTAGLILVQIPISIMLWEYTLVRGLAFIITSAAFLTKAKIIGWVAFSIAESIAFYYFDEHVFPDDAAPLNISNHEQAWYDGLEEIERLVDSDVNSPEIYLNYLYQTQNIVYQRYIHFLSTFEKELLTAEARYGSFEKARAHYADEAQRLAPLVEAH